MLKYLYNKTEKWQKHFSSFSTFIPNNAETKHASLPVETAVGGWLASCLDISRCRGLFSIRKPAKSEDQHFIVLIFPLFFSLCSFRFVSTSCFLFLCFLSWFPSCFCLFPTDLISSLLPSVPRVYYRHVNDGCVDVNHWFSDCFGLFQWSAVNSRENNNCTGDAL